VEEANFRPSGEAGGERLHPALLSLIIARQRDLALLLRPQKLRSVYAELGFKIGDRQLRNHVRWLLEHEYIIIYVARRGPRVELTEKGLSFLKALGLLEGVRA
jgi:repressor of nif and glnA expression